MIGRRIVVGFTALLALGVLALALRGESRLPGSTPKLRQGKGESGQLSPVRLTSIDGRPVALPVGRPGALFFTVSSCVSCVRAGKALGDLKRRLADDLDVAWIGIDPSDPPDRVRARRASMGRPPYPFAVDRTGTLAGRYGVTALGTAIVYDRQDRVVARLIEPSAQQLAVAVRRAAAA